MIGYSSYAIIVIRSNANPPMDQNNPDDVFNLLYYLNREQYGDRPLLYGQYYHAQVENYEEGSPVYVKRDGKYHIVNHKPETVYASDDCTVFPRMYSPSPDNIEVYRDFSGMKTSQSEPKMSNNISSLSIINLTGCIGVTLCGILLADKTIFREMVMLYMETGFRASNLLTTRDLVSRKNYQTT
jgi:hypothetical protein